MELSETYNQYTEAIKAIKSAILQSRYTAARLVNREMLMLYYGVGEYISQHSRIDVWGTGALEIIAKQLQQKLPGLRGFSVTNLKNMRVFYEEWRIVIQNLQLPIGESRNRQSATADLDASFDTANLLNRQSPTAEIAKFVLIESDNNLNNRKK